MLAEGGEVVLNEFRASMIRKLNDRGVVSAICSKNDPQAGQQKLEQFGLWDQFVFPRFQFLPKGQVIRQIIEDMNLRAINVLFIDDEVHNLQEAKFHLPDLNIVNAAEPACDQLLAQILDHNKNFRRNRIEEYRLLENRARDRQAQSMNAGDFLRSCDIHAALVRRTDNMQFGERIEELVNRANQLNFTKSRIDPGTICNRIADVTCCYSYAIFVWDKYGYHGLVGFAALEDFSRIVDIANPVRSNPRLTHFVFSCRVMNMAIENWLLDKILLEYPELEVSELPIQPLSVDWIQGEEFSDPAIKDLIWEKEKDKSRDDIKLRVMAACQSGALAHYSGLSAIAEFDNLDSRAFSLREFEGDAWRNRQYPDSLVYAVFEHFETLGEATGASVLYEKCAREFCLYLSANNKKLLVLLTAENRSTRKKREDVPYLQAAAALPKCNNVWRTLAMQYEDVSIIEIGDLAAEDEIIDLYHFDVPLLKQLGDHIRHWYEGGTISK